MACKTDGGGIPGSVAKSTGFKNYNWSDVHKPKKQEEERVQVPYLAPQDKNIFDTPWSVKNDVKQILDENSIHEKAKSLAYKNDNNNDNNNGGFYT